MLILELHFDRLHELVHGPLLDRKGQQTHQGQWDFGGPKLYIYYGNKGVCFPFDVLDSKVDNR